MASDNQITGTCCDVIVNRGTKLLHLYQVDSTFVLPCCDDMIMNELYQPLVIDDDQCDYVISLVPFQAQASLHSPSTDLSTFLVSFLDRPLSVSLVSVLAFPASDIKETMQVDLCVLQ